jgi:hypothetical protein
LQPLLAKAREGAFEPMEYWTLLATLRDSGVEIGGRLTYNQDQRNAGFKLLNRLSKACMRESAKYGKVTFPLCADVLFHVNLHQSNIGLARGADETEAYKHACYACDISLIGLRKNRGDVRWQLMRLQSLLRKVQTICDIKGSGREARAALTDAEKLSRITELARIDYLRYAVTFDLKVDKDLEAAADYLAEADGLIAKHATILWTRLGWNGAVATLALRQGHLARASQLLSKLAHDAVDADCLHYFEMARMAACAYNVRIKLPEFRGFSRLRLGALIPAFYQEDILRTCLAGL